MQSPRRGGESDSRLVGPAECRGEGGRGRIENELEPRLGRGFGDQFDLLQDDRIDRRPADWRELRCRRGLHGAAGNRKSGKKDRYQPRSC